MTTTLLLADLRRDEGLRLTAYPDPDSPLGAACKAAGVDVSNYHQVPNWAALNGAPWTDGYGNAVGVKPGDTITDAQAEALLESDVAAVQVQLNIATPWWVNLDPVRSDAFCELGFNLGVHKLVTDFPDTISAIKGGAYAVAGDDLAADAWAREVGPGRSGRIIAMLKTGQRPA